MNTHILDLNQDLPEAVKRELIASWDPPNWLDLEAELDPATGKITMAGNRWALHVTYSSGDMMGGGDYKVKSIHTPYATAVNMTRDGDGRFKKAWGAAENFIP